MSANTNRKKGIAKEGILLKLLNENGILTLSLAPNIAGDLVLPLHKTVIEVKSTQKYFSPFSSEKLRKQYKTLEEYMNKGLNTYYAVFFKNTNEWKFYKLSLKDTKQNRGISFENFLKEVKDYDKEDNKKVTKEISDKE